MLLFLAIALVSFYVAVLCLYKLFTLKAYVLIIPIMATLFSAILFGYIFICNISNKMILNNLSLTIKKGQTIALVGPTGGGKTTICHLLPRFFMVFTTEPVKEGQKSVRRHSVSCPDVQ